MFEAASSTESSVDRYVIIAMAIPEIAEYTQLVFRKVVHSRYNVPAEILYIEICFEACFVDLLFLWMCQYLDHLLKENSRPYAIQLVRSIDYYVTRKVVFFILVLVLLGY
jgi:hypothetical protein